MKKLICMIFGHDAYTYNGGTDVSPEQAWACRYCRQELTYDDCWSLDLNHRFTRWLRSLGEKKINNDDIPF